VGEAEDLRPLGHRARERVEVVLGAGVRVHLVHDLQRVAEALGLRLPGVEVARVVVGEEEDLVPRLEVQPARDEVVRLARVAGEDDLLGSDAQELRDRASRRLLALPELHAVRERGIPVEVAGRRHHRVDHHGRRGAQVRRVHHSEVGGHEELLAHGQPVALRR
jgi:hypothetical protein